MKKITLSAILLMTLIGINSNTFAQRDADRKVHAEIRVLAGGSLGDYSAYSGFENSIYNFDYKFTPTGELVSIKNDNKEAGAGFTWGLGVKVAFGLPVRNLALFVDASAMVSSPNSSLDNEFGNNKLTNDDIAASITKKRVTSPAYVNIPIMGGIRYDIDFSHNFGMFLEAGAGVNFGTISPISQEYTYSFAGSKITYEYSLNSQNSISFAFQGGLGFNIGQRVRLGINYLNLGNIDSNFDLHYSTTTSSTFDEDQIDDLEGGSYNPQMLIGSIAIVF